MKQENTNLPLWKVLNEQRTKGEWRQFGYKEKSPYLETDEGTVAQFNFGGATPAVLEDIANARYTALAVNNLHILAEALEGVIRVADRKTDEFDKAKEALKRIS